MSPGKISLIFMLAAVISGCSEYPKDTEVLRVNAAAVNSQNTSGSLISIHPDKATVGTIISLRGNDSVLNEAEIKWYVNESINYSLKGMRITTNDLRKGDAIRASVTKDNTENYSNHITIKNTPPAIHNAELVPDRPKVASTVSINVTADDVDRDNIILDYEWTVNGKLAGRNRSLDTELKRGDEISVTVTPSDGEDSGRNITIKKQVANSLPVISDSEPVFEGNIYSYSIKASDPDEDTLVYKLEEGPEGMTINQNTGELRWTVEDKDSGYHEIKISVSDNHGGMVLIPLTTKISFEKLNQ